METKTITVNAWVHPGNGQVRRYIDWQDELLDVDYYKTGNVRSALYKGEGVSNSQARRLLQCKAWLDGANRVHVKVIKGIDESEFLADIRGLLDGAEIIEQ